MRHGVARNIGHTLPIDNVKDQQVVDDFPSKAQALSKLRVAIDREAVARQRHIGRGIALADRPGITVLDNLADFEVFEEIAFVALFFQFYFLGFPVRNPLPASKTLRRCECA